MTLYLKKVFDDLKKFKEVILLITFFFGLLFVKSDKNIDKIIVSVGTDNIVLPEKIDNKFKKHYFKKLIIENIEDEELKNVELNIYGEEIISISAESTSKYLQDKIGEIVKYDKKSDGYYTFKNLTTLPPNSITTYFVWSNGNSNMIDSLLNEPIIAKVDNKEVEIKQIFTGFVNGVDSKNIKNFSIGFLYLLLFSILFVVSRKIR